MSPSGDTTRDTIVAAAYRVLSKVGMSKASVKEIAAEAGVAPGLIHYHFRDKDDLFAAVVRLMSSNTSQKWKAVRAEPSDGDFMDTAFNLLSEQIADNHPFYTARFELYALAMTNKRIRPEIKAVLDEARSGISGSLRVSGLGNNHQNTQLASVIFACLDGIAMQAIVDPEFDPQDALGLLKQMLLAFKGTS